MARDDPVDQVPAHLVQRLTAREAGEEPDAKHVVPVGLLVLLLLQPPQSRLVPCPLRLLLQLGQVPQLSLQLVASDKLKGYRLGAGIETTVRGLLGRIEYRYSIMATAKVWACSLTVIRSPSWPATASRTRTPGLYGSGVFACAAQRAASLRLHPRLCVIPGQILNDQPKALLVKRHSAKMPALLQHLR